MEVINLGADMQFPHVYHKLSGRSGELAYVDKDRQVSVYIEMSGTPDYKFLVWLDTLKNQKWSALWQPHWAVLDLQKCRLKKCVCQKFCA